MVRSAQHEPLTTQYEDRYWTDTPGICGIDEAGRGPLAGPVVAAAVVFPRFYRPEGILRQLNDSKILAPSLRASLADAVKEASLDFGISVIDNLTIDRMNILQATMLAMNKAVLCLDKRPDYLMVDGNRFRPDLPIPFETFVKGDSRVFSIAAASVLAKTERDRIMKTYAEEYPLYGFDKHFGYPTKAHVAAIEKYGRCPLHRKSFRLKALGE